MPYNPPFLDRLITLRDPSDEPTIQRDEFGRPVDSPSWGTQVWSNRRDQIPFVEVAEGIQVRAGRSVFTIRHTTSISPLTLVLDADGTPYTLAGSPIERGGVNGGMLERYLEAPL